MLNEKERNNLYKHAKKASELSYSPYSNFRVGAAVLTNGKKVFLGTNIENVSYGLTICAERVAICNAIINNSIDIIAIAIFSKKGGVSPCGACRQFIIEFGKDIEVIFKNDKNIISETIEKLIPKPVLKGDIL